MIGRHERSAYTLQILQIDASRDKSGYGLSLFEPSDQNVYLYVFRLFSELIAPRLNSMCIKCYDFEHFECPIYFSSMKQHT
jgi:hypothetical protein